MEAETTASVTETTTAGSSENVRSNDDFGVTLSRCGSCKENVQGRRPKLLSCLHTFCQQCISSLETGESMLVRCLTNDDYSAPRNVKHVKNSQSGTQGDVYEIVLVLRLSGNNQLKLNEIRERLPYQNNTCIH